MLRKNKGNWVIHRKNRVSVEVSIISEQLGFKGAVLTREEGCRLDSHLENEFLMDISTGSDKYLKNL